MMTGNNADHTSRVVEEMKEIIMTLVATTTKCGGDGKTSVTNNVEGKTVRILDLCCGQGRHSIELLKEHIMIPNDIFVEIYGLDQSSFLIQLARDRCGTITARSEEMPSPLMEEEQEDTAGTNTEEKDKWSTRRKIAFTVGDCRSIPFPDDYFDIVLVMGNSFGYFSSSDDDAKVLCEIRRVLVPQRGIVVLDLTDGDYMRNTFSPRSWEWIDNTTFVCRERQLSRDKKRLISRELITSTERGVIRDQCYQERLYSRFEAWHMLREAQFRSPRTDKKPTAVAISGRDTPPTPAVKDEKSATDDHASGYVVVVKPAEQGESRRRGVDEDMPADDHDDEDEDVMNPAQAVLTGKDMSKRNQDLGMMECRMLLVAEAFLPKTNKL
jgi:ubiquinone/menaquinone biosynthesis C-methylase UbiE